MSNCCMRMPAKFYVDNFVRCLAIANIREGALNAPSGEAGVKGPDYSQRTPHASECSTYPFSV